MKILNKTYTIIRKYPLLPGLIIFLLVTIASFSELISPNDPLYSDLSKIKQPPFWFEGGTMKYLLGGDFIGRDLLSRIIYGSRISLMVAGAVLISGGTIGTFAGIVAGYKGGVWDEVIMRLVDMTYAIPFLLVAMVATVVFGSSLSLLLILLIIFSWPPFARQTRGLTLQLKDTDYVAAARIAGAGPFRIGYRHILPGLVNIVIVLGTLQVGSLILTESVLSYLGVGIPAPQPAWGTMVADGRQFIANAWWIAVMPGLAIFLTVFAFNFLGDWLRDYYDPRLRQI